MGAVPGPKTTSEERKRHATNDQTNESYWDPDGDVTELETPGLRPSVLYDLTYTRHIDVRVWLCIVGASFHRDKPCLVA